MEAELLFILFVILLAFVFDFINGFHDASNSIATIVATGVLTPRQAVIWAAFFNFIAFLFFKLSVANTIGTGLINPELVDSTLICAALIGAIIWNLITWYYGLPSSSSHALIGGLAGAALAKGGLAALKFSAFTKIIIAIILSPLLGILLGLLIATLINKLTHNYSEATKYKWFKTLQLFSSAMLSLAHGGNDAQKTMGIIAVLLYSANWLGEVFYVPFWVVIGCHLVMGLGTLAGGWRIVHTLGKKITHLNYMNGCAAETSAAIIISTATNLGIPISTTHTVTGTIAGVGVAGNINNTNWSILYRIFSTWVLTIPSSALIAASIIYLQKILV